MFGTKAPRTSRNGQHPTFQTVPAATALYFLPLGFLQKCAPLATLAMLMRAFVRFQRPGELMCWSWAFPLLTLLSAARFLGLKPSASELDYVDLVLDGLPLKSLDVIVKVVAPTDPTFKYRIVPKSSLHRLSESSTPGRRQRSKAGGRRLSTAQSVIVARLASVWAQAERVWKSPNAARDFLYRKHPLLDDRRPLDVVLKNEFGAELVRGVLGRLEHGSAV